MNSYKKQYSNKFKKTKTIAIKENSNQNLRPKKQSSATANTQEETPKGMGNIPTLIKIKHSQAIFTIVSNNYLHFARTLLQSVKVCHPNTDLFCVIVDTDLTESQKFSADFTTLDINQLGLPGGDGFLFQYTVLELNTAVKPWAIEYLLLCNYENVIYIDPDIYVYRPLKEVTDLLGSGSDIVLTPHLLSPITDEKIPSELDIRRSGTYNFGFCAVRRTKNTYDFVRWWQGKLTRDCVVDLDKGIFVDQSWIDLVPGLFSNVTILRHPGYNIAYWNIAQRSVKRQIENGYTINGQPLTFFHYSGFNPLKPEAFSKHQNRFTLSTLGEAGDLAKEYAKKLLSNDAELYIKKKYGYGVFSDGTPIPDIFRSEYRTDDDLRKRAGENPFHSSESLCFSIPRKGGESIGLTYALRAVWNARSDLQKVFPLNTSESVVDFYHWFLTDGIIYFPESVITHHLNIVNDYLRLKVAIGSETVVQFQRKPHSARSVTRVHALFHALLERKPEPSAIAHYAPLCETMKGSIRAWRDISLSYESRLRPDRILRMARALLPTSYREMVEVSHVSIPLNNSTAPAVSSTKPRGTYSGFHHPEVDSDVSGIWVSEKVVTPLNAKAGDVVKIQGIYFPDFIAKQTGEPSATLRFSVNEISLQTYTLQAPGEFSHSFNLADDFDAVQDELIIESSKKFVPRDIGLNSDNRSLAWQIKYLSVGKFELVDVKREPILFPLEEYFSPPGINLVGYVSAESGVGEAARLFAKAAHAGSIPYSIVDVGYQNPNLQRDKSAFANASSGNFDIDIVYVNADQTPRTLEYLSSINHKSRYTIGFWHWEQPKLPNAYLNAFQGLTEVWTPSAFVQDAVAKISPIPVYKVPHAIEFTTTSGVNRRDFGLPEKCFLALVMYDFHSYQFRKNPQAAIEAFRIAAGNKPDVALVIKTINAESHPNDYTLLRNSMLDIKNIIFIDRFLTRQEVYDLEFCCDTLISLHRAEGFGLALAEMMFLGKPVIATGWSANMEFMSPMNSLPVQYELVPLKKTIGVYEAGQEWAEANVEHAAECLSLLIRNPVVAKKIGERAANSIRHQLSPEAIGRQYRARLALVARG